MFSATALILLALSPPSPPPTLAIADEYTQPDGQRVRWASVMYDLPTAKPPNCSSLLMRANTVMGG